MILSSQQPSLQSVISRNDMRQIPNRPRRRFGDPGDEPNLRLIDELMLDGIEHIGSCSFQTTIGFFAYPSTRKLDCHYTGRPSEGQRLLLEAGRRCGLTPIVQRNCAECLKMGMVRTRCNHYDSQTGCIRKLDHHRTKRLTAPTTFALFLLPHALQSYVEVIFLIRSSCSKRNAHRNKRSLLRAHLLRGAWQSGLMKLR
jgi:hypothetical protein